MYYNSNDITVFPTSNSYDEGRYTLERNMRDIARRITNKNYVISGMDLSVEDNEVIINAGEASIMGYHINTSTAMSLATTSGTMYIVLKLIFNTAGLEGDVESEYRGLEVVLMTENDYNNEDKSLMLALGRVKMSGGSITVYRDNSSYLTAISSSNISTEVKIGDESNFISDGYLDVMGIANHKNYNITYITPDATAIASDTDISNQKSILFSTDLQTYLRDILPNWYLPKFGPSTYYGDLTFEFEADEFLSRYVDIYDTGIKIFNSDPIDEFYIDSQVSAIDKEVSTAYNVGTSSLDIDVNLNSAIIDLSDTNISNILKITNNYHDGANYTNNSSILSSNTLRIKSLSDIVMETLTGDITLTGNIIELNDHHEGSTKSKISLDKSTGIDIYSINDINLRSYDTANNGMRLAITDNSIIANYVNSTGEVTNLDRLFKIDAYRMFDVNGYLQNVNIGYIRFPITTLIDSQNTIDTFRSDFYIYPWTTNRNIIRNSKEDNMKGKVIEIAPNLMSSGVYVCNSSLANIHNYLEITNDSENSDGSTDVSLRYNKRAGENSYTTTTIDSTGITTVDRFIKLGYLSTLIDANGAQHNTEFASIANTGFVAIDTQPDNNHYFGISSSVEHRKGGCVTLNTQFRGEDQYVSRSEIIFSAASDHKATIRGGYNSNSQFYGNWSGKDERLSIVFDNSSLSTNYLRVGGSLLVEGDIKANGDITANRVYNAVYNDYADFVKKDLQHKYEPGDIIAKKPNSNEYTIATYENRKLVVGVYSDTYGHVLGGEHLSDMEDNKDKYVPIAVAGNVNVKVTGAISEGDLITISEIDGVGMKVDNIIGSLGCIVGKALENKSTSGIARINAQVMLS